MIDLNPEMGTRAKQVATAAVQAERLSPGTPQNGDAIVRAHGNANRETPAEMTGDGSTALLINKVVKPLELLCGELYATSPTILCSVLR